MINNVSSSGTERYLMNFYILNYNQFVKTNRLSTHIDIFDEKKCFGWDVGKSRKSLTKWLESSEKIIYGIQFDKKFLLWCFGLF